MLSLLHIENIAVIERSDISFHPGLNVLTGETGAGKSIIIDAISAILGERAYRDMIRTGSNMASVQAVFTDVPEFSWFFENGVPYDKETVIHRQIYLDGKNVCRVNGTLVSVSILRKLGALLVDIHGQHDSASLFDENSHLQFLDSFSDNEELRNNYLQAFSVVEQLRSEIRRMDMDESEKLRRMETLRFQIEEIEKAQLTAGEDDVLNERRKVLQNAEKIADAVNATVASLYGDDESEGAAALLSDAQKELARLSRFSDSFSALNERVTDLMYQVRDVAEEVLQQRNSISYSEEELDNIEARLDVIHRLKRKYGASCDEILVYLERARRELDDITFAGDRLEKLKKQLADAQAVALGHAHALRNDRKAAAQRLADQILTELAQLDMPKVQFSCEFTETEMTTNGIDAVSYYMSANAGEALKPLGKVASGGELSRIMLAMKNVLARQDKVHTQIFDEVDAGVSGRAAQKVAEKLKTVSAGKQVLCVTHLAQIAAMGDVHMQISKEERQGRTYTTVTPLDRNGRVRELARIIGGANITENTLKSAEEMLSR